MSILNYQYFKKKKMEKRYIILGTIDDKVQNYVWHYFKTSMPEEAMEVLDGCRRNIQNGDDQHAEEITLYELKPIESRLI